MTAPLPSLLISIPEGIIDLRWGHPSPRLHPVALMQQAAAHALGSGDVTALQYGAEQGFGPLLESIAAFLSQQEAYAMQVEPETLFLTSGASQAIDLACTLFAEAGDTVLVEEPTYYLAQGIFADHRLRIIGVPTDASGLRVDTLEAMLSGTTPPAFLYTIPSFQNPTGVVLTLERRRALVELAQRYGFILLADEVYQLLHYGPPPPPPLVAFDTSAAGTVISLGSFSKVLSPGLRLGWIQAHPGLIERFSRAGFVVSGGGVNHFTSALVYAVFKLDLLAENIDSLRATYGERVQVLSKALQEHLPEVVSFAVPGGGFFFWLTCQEEIDTEALLPLAHQAGVSYHAGPDFSSRHAFTNALRLSFALYEPDELVQGVERLAKAFAAYRSIRPPLG